MNIERINDEIRITLTLDDLLARTDLDYSTEIEILRDDANATIALSISRFSPDDDFAPVDDETYRISDDYSSDEIDAETIAFTYGDTALAAVRSLPTIE